MPETTKHSLWMGVAERVGSYLVVFAIAFMWVGSTRQKVQQKVLTLEDKQVLWDQEWKIEKAHITAMDLEGSVATKNFIENYNRKQAEQDATVKELQKQMGHLETMQWRIERLEKNKDP